MTVLRNYSIGNYENILNGPQQYLKNKYTTLNIKVKKILFPA